MGQGFEFFIVADYAAGDAYYGGVIRNRVHHYAAGADFDVVTNANVA